MSIEILKRIMFEKRLDYPHKEIKTTSVKNMNRDSKPGPVGNSTGIADKKRTTSKNDKTEKR